MNRACLHCIALAVFAFAGASEALAAGRAGTVHCKDLGLVLATAADQGLEVVQVRDSSRAAGLHRGDLLLAVDGKPLRSPQQLCALSSADRAAHLLLVERDSGRTLVPIILQRPALRWSAQDPDHSPI